MSYHEEQETLDHLKAWWAKWGNAVSSIVLVVLAAAAGWNLWQYWQREQAAKAALLYEQLQAATQSGGAEQADKEHVARIAADLESRYARTAYAQMGALLAAGTLYGAGDAGAAKTQLQWAAGHGDEAFRALARLRLAGVLLDQKDYDAGLRQLAAPPAAFAGLYDDRRGDLLAAQGKRDDARAAYRQALQTLAQDDGSIRQLVQFKLDALGG